MTPAHTGHAQATCIHMDLATPKSVYIGRAMKDADGRFRAGLGLTRAAYLPGSIWQNPFKIEQDTPEARVQAIRLFRSRIWQSTIRWKLHELRGRELACFCHPKACHGDILADLANKIHHHGATCPDSSCGGIITSYLAPSPEDQDQIQEVWRCVRCRTHRKEDRGSVLIHHITPTLL